MLPKYYSVKSIPFVKIVILISLALFFIILQWNHFNKPLERDEATYAYIAWRLKEGDLPYRDVFDHKPPLIFYTYLLAYLINPESYWPARLLAAGFIILSCILLAKLANKEFGKNSGLILGFIFFSMLAWPFFTVIYANSEIFLLLPLVISIFIYLNKQKHSSWWHWLLFGVFSTLTVFYKPTPALSLLFIFIVWFLETWKKHGVQKTYPKVIFAIFGAFLTSLLLLSPFLISDGGKSFVEAVILDNVYYLSDITSLSSLKNFLFFMANWPLVWILVFIYFLKRPKRWWFYSGLLFSSIVTVLFNTSFYYYVILIPFVALICTHSINSLIPRLKILKANIENNPANLKAFVTLILTISLLIPSISQIFPQPYDYVVKLYGQNPPISESPLVAKRVAELTETSDTVFVMGAETQILYYSKRKSPSRFIHSYPFLVSNPHREIFQKETLDNLNKNRPKIIVLSTFPASYSNGEYKPEWLLINFFEFLDQNYHLLGGYVRADDTGYWQEPIHPENVQKSTLLVYKRI